MEHLEKRLANNDRVQEGLVNMTQDMIRQQDETAAEVIDIHDRTGLLEGQ